MRTAFQQSVLHRELPKKQWTKAEEVSYVLPTRRYKLISQDGRYLAPIVEQVAKEDKEREMWDNVTVERRK
jgi:ubiquinol-cytochrome c reductase subunit 7